MSKEKNSLKPTQLPLFDPVTITLTRGFKAIIDPVDADLTARKWYTAGDIAGNRPYAAREEKGVTILLHVVIMGRVLGRKMEQGEEVDHKDNDPFNDRRSNLRIATHSQNMGNTRRRTKNKSGYKGVSRHQNSWQSQIMIDGKKIYLGVYKTPEEAYRAYCDAARKYFGEFARLE